MSFLENDRVLFGDGLGGIYTCDPDGSNLYRVPYSGFDPAWCWGGNAVIFADMTRKTIWVANLDGTGLYNTGVSAEGTGNLLALPHLNDATGVYFVNYWDAAAQSYRLYKYGAGGYGITLMASGLEWGYAVHQNGLSLYCSGLTGGRYQLLYMWTDMTHAGWVNRDDTANSPDARHPAIDHVFNDGYTIAYQTGDLIGMDHDNPATYKHHDLARLNPAGPGYSVTPWHIPGTQASGSDGMYIDGPHFSADDSYTLFDFSCAAGSGIWATAGIGSFNNSVYTNPNGRYAQLHSYGNCRVKRK